MDIEEMQKKKTKIEQEICNLLNNFEEETLIKVYDVGFDRGFECSARDSFIFNVKLDIRL